MRTSHSLVVQVQYSLLGFFASVRQVGKVGRYKVDKQSSHGQPPETYVLTAAAVTVNTVGLFHSLPTCTYLQDSAPLLQGDTTSP